MKPLWILTAVAFAGCSGSGNSNGDAGLDANITLSVDPAIKVSGAVEVHPSAAQWLTSTGQTGPSLDGLSLTVEEPLKAAAGDSTANLGSDPLESSGTFTVNGVETAGLVLGLAARVDDPAGGGTIVPTSTFFFDTAIDETRPSVDQNKVRAFVLPKIFADQLTEAVSQPEILALTNQTCDSLIEAGFIVGRVVDENGIPVGGVKLETGDAARDERFVYPAADFFSAGRAGTSATGLFIYVHDGTTVAPTPFTFAVKNKPEYKRRNGIATPGVGLVVMVFPGTTSPP